MGNMLELGDRLRADLLAAHSGPRPMKRGDFVRTYFDTGALGAQILLGRVMKAGRATYTVEWESGIRNRIVQGYKGVELVTETDLLGIARRQFNPEAQ